MKKNVLALSITAALIGLTGGAHAMSAIGELKGASADTLVTNNAGIGHMLIVPYYSTQGNNATLINIVNTDTVGKAVKVRFRGAANSDDVFDFQVFLSPKDVWTASLSKDKNGLTQLTTNDNSCTKPARAVLNVTPFVTTRLDPTMTDAFKASGTREGYVEIFNMADIIPTPTNALATAITHDQKTGLPPGCGLPGTTGSTAAWTALDALNSVFTYDESQKRGLSNPTSGLMANWTIIDTTSAATWAGQATAFEAINSASVGRATGNLAYWPQTNVYLTTAEIVGFTSDPIFTKAGTSASANLTWATLDLPDMSTPYVRVSPTNSTAVTAIAQANMLTKSIASTSGTNEFWTESAFAAQDDWVFSMPTRRYAVAFDYAANVPLFSPSNYFVQNNNVTTRTSTETLGNGRMVCVSKADMTFAPVDREEKVPTPGSFSVVVSPAPVGGAPDQFRICGEVAVLSINNGTPVAGLSSGALKASVTLQDISTATVSDKFGWMTIATPGVIDPVTGASGLPLLGGSFVRAAIGAQGFGAKYNHRFVRPAGFVSKD